MRWRLYLSEFNLEVIQNSTIIHQVADALSWLLAAKAGNTPLDNDVATVQIDNDNEPDAAYVCPCFTYEGETSLEPALPLVANLLKTASYAQPSTLARRICNGPLNGCILQAGSHYHRETGFHHFIYD